MTTDLAVVQQLRNTLDLPERDRGAAEAVAAGLRDAKAGNTRRAYNSGWQQFRTWAEAGGHPALPAAPQAVALYLGHLASTGRSIATVQQARSAISHFHAAAGMGKGDNPALHPVVSEAVKGWRNRASAPRQAGALTADALARVREVLRLPKRGRGGRMESADSARRRAALDLAIIGVLADGGLRRSEAAALTWSDVELWADMMRPDPTADNPMEVAMTDSVRPVCDCPEPCACYAEGYAAGKNKAYFEVLASLEGPPHAEGCACQPCQVKRACLQKVMTLMARSSPGLFEQVEAWVLDGHDY